MNDKAVSLMKLTKSQILELYTDAQRKLSVIKLYLEKCFDDIECIVCGECYDDCSCHYDLGDAYLEKIQEVIEGKVVALQKEEMLE